LIFSNSDILTYFKGIVPSRIVSLVPSHTQTLHYFNLETEVLGITKFCIAPDEWFKTKVRVGGTKTVNIEKVGALRPELIIANKEENDKSTIEILGKTHVVWLTDIITFDDLYDFIFTLGKIIEQLLKSQNLVSEIKQMFSNQKNLFQKENLKVAYAIWNKPLMLAGDNTFINSVLKNLGFDNIATKLNGRYPECAEATIKKLQLDVFFLSSEPFPFNTKHQNAYSIKLKPTLIVLANGELFSWYRSGILKLEQHIIELKQTILL